MTCTVHIRPIAADGPGTRRQRETAAVAALVGELLPGAELGHHPSGAPRITGRPDLHISVSHSRTHAAVALSERPVGIDIEQQRDQLGRVASKFLTEKERLAFNTPRLLLMAWTATEAVYKAAHAGGADPGPVELPNDIELGTPTGDTLLARLKGTPYRVTFTAVGADSVLAVAEPE